MIKRWGWLTVFASLGIVVVAAVYGARSPRPEPIRNPQVISRSPRITPDYRDLIIPPNIAPLNLRIDEPGTRCQIRISSPNSPPIEVAGRSMVIDIPSESWRKLLAANAGNTLRIEVFVRNEKGRWSTFEPLTNIIAREPIDHFLLYRRIDPVFRCWGNIGIQQRDLTSFEDKGIVWNRSVKYDCVNCHAVSSGAPDRMLLQLRSETIGPRMILAHDGHISRISTATDFNRSASSYVAWHPSGQIVAFAAIKVTQFFHTMGETRDVFDQSSDLGIYLVDSNTVTTTPAIARPDRLETYPAWSPDGKYLYFCSGPQLPIERFSEVKYDLMRISYDPRSSQWGELEMVLTAQQIKGSVTHPKLSPDGRFLLFCVCDYGNFSIYHPESDLFLMDLTSRRYEKLAINSDRSDSYHSWSANGRWIVFSSKRRDGLLTHPYIAYVDGDGRVHKPFILPQRDPAFYESCLKVFNVPELSNHPAPLSSQTFTKAMNDPSNLLAAKLDSQVKIRSTTAPAHEGPWRSPQ